MGAGGRRAGRGLSRPPVLAGTVATREPSYLAPVTGILYALGFGATALALDQLVNQVEGPWFELLGGALILISVMGTWMLLRAAWRRHRENLNRRAASWGLGAIAAALLSPAAIYVLVQTASFASVISGADIHLTRPVLQSLPHPPGAKLLNERPGLEGTESITDRFSTGDLAAVVPFYESALVKSGWAEDKSTAGTLLVQFLKGSYLVTVAPDQPTGAGAFAVTVDRLSPNLLSPSPSLSTSP